MAASRRRRWRCYSFPELVNREVLKTLDANFDYDVEAFRNETKDYGTISGGRGYFGWPQAATAETGKQLVATRGRNIANVILREWGKLNKTDRTE